MPAPDIRSAPQMKTWRETYPDDQFLAEMRDRASDAVPVNNACGRYIAVVPVGRAEMTRLLLIIQELQNPLLPITPPPPGLQGGAIGMESGQADPPVRDVKYAKDMHPAHVRGLVRVIVEAGHLPRSLISHPNRDESVRLELDDYALIIPIRDIIMAAGDIIAEKAGG